MIPALLALALSAAPAAWAAEPAAQAPATHGAPLRVQADHVQIDDGVATGATLKASLLSLRGSGAARTILALPTAPPDTLETLAALVDDVICLHQPSHFRAVGSAYRHFPQSTDEDVVAIMQRCARYAEIKDTP